MLLRVSIEFYRAPLAETTWAVPVDKPKIIHNEKPGGESGLDSLCNQAMSLSAGKWLVQIPVGNYRPDVAGTEIVLPAESALSFKLTEPVKFAATS